MGSTTFAQDTITPAQELSLDAIQGNFAIVPSVILPSLHAYGYASADPANHVDPSGRADAVEEEGIDSEIDLQEVGRKTVPKGAFWGGIGLTGLGLEIACLYDTEAPVSEL